MRIIMSPAKKMIMDTDSINAVGVPVFLKETNNILEWLKSQTYEELKSLWKCNDKITGQNIERLEHMKLTGNLTPAILSYDGIAFKYMAPAVFEDNHYDYVQEHLRILSAFYGVLKPMDGVVPYRLEMQAKASIDGHKDLYELWGSRLYEEVGDDSGIIINLASKEYSRIIERYLKPTDRYITITFVESSGGKLLTKGTYAKMARGDMVRFMAEKKIENPEDIKAYNRMGYAYRDDLSDTGKYVFEKSISVL